jgi:hypothetical protein
MRPLLLSAVLVLASRSANAACVISGARPTVPLPTMEVRQEFSFVASLDCETLRFTIRGTTVSKMPKSGGPVGPGPNTYKVVLTESEWNAVVAEIGPTLTWVVTGRTSAGVTTRMVTTNELTADGGLTMSLSRADAKLVGPEENDRVGMSVSGAGDVDGDGRDDLLVGASGDGEGGAYAGAAYLVLGPVTGTLDLARADAKLVGEGSTDSAGTSVSGAGDVDADGHDDVLVGAPLRYEGGSYTGAAYLVSGPVTGTLDLGFADAKLVGESGSGYWAAFQGVSGAGDVDGDGHDDLLVGGCLDDEGAPNAGAAYLVLGPVSGTLDLSLADAKFVGEDQDDFVGCSVSGAGDVDADGHDDLLVGGAWNDAHGRINAGAAYLVLGPVSGTLDLSLADAKLVGENRSDYAGDRIADAGDVDGDGHADLLVGSPQNDEGGFGAGAAYLVLGPVTGMLDLSRAHAKLVGEDVDDNACVVSGAGDVDANGHDDLFVGAPYGGASAAYLVLGPVTGTVDLSLADATFISEEPNSEAGSSVAGAGDVDADGRDDVLVGAPYNGGTGAAYLIYGGGL